MSPVRWTLDALRWLARLRISRPRRARLTSQPAGFILTYSQTLADIGFFMTITRRAMVFCAGGAPSEPPGRFYYPGL